MEIFRKIINITLTSRFNTNIICSSTQSWHKNVWLKNKQKKNPPKSSVLFVLWGEIRRGVCGCLDSSVTLCRSVRNRGIEVTSSSALTAERTNVLQSRTAALFDSHNAWSHIQRNQEAVKDSQDSSKRQKAVKPAAPFQSKPPNETDLQSLEAAGSTHRWGPARRHCSCRAAVMNSWMPRDTKS